MASQVPYSGAPTQTLQQQGISPVHEDTPVAAFGGAVAGAITHLGQVEEGAGKELFSRAIAMQELNMQAKADTAAASYATDLGQIHAGFMSKTGQAAVDAYPAYIQQVNELRETHRQGLDNPYAQLFYDRDTRRQQSYYMTAAGGYAAQQNKAFAKDSLKSANDVAFNGIGINPTDEAAFNQSIERAKANINQQSDLDGIPADSPIRQARIQDMTSHFTYGRITALAKQSPFQAETFLNDAIKSGAISGADALNAYNTIKNHQYQVGSRNISNESTAGQGNWVGESIVSSDQARVGIKAVEGGIYTAEGQMTYKNGVENGRAQGAYQVMEGNLTGWLKEAGMPAMTKQQFLKDPQAQDKLFDFKFGQYMTQYGNFNRAARAWFTGNPDAPADVSDKTPTTRGTTVEQYLAKANGAMARTAPVNDVTADARARAEKLLPGDSLFAQEAERHAYTVHTHELQVQKEQEFTNRNVVDEAVNTLGPDGKLPTSVDELMKNDQDGKFTTAWTSMNPIDRDRYLKQFERNSKEGYAATPENQQMYQRYLGVALNPGSSPKDLEEFMSKDIGGLPLPAEQRLRLINLQKQVFKNAQANPALNHALGLLSKTDPAVRQALQDKDGDGPLYVGALHEAMEQYMQANKKPPGDKEITEMGAQLMRGMHSDRFWFKSSTDPLYRAEVPSSDREDITKAFQAQGRDPTEQEIHNAYVANRFNKFYSSGQMPNE